ncbi:hypothetical protein BDV97DRAFT_372683 [Delphinella strobiligena]|nr:hypothetical protein BDV97DRAFT_372683 [Delphinella strobiligena]
MWSDEEVVYWKRCRKLTTPFHNGSLLGAAWAASTIDPIKSSRCSSKTAYLEDASETTSIDVYTQTRAEKILCEGNTAVGVLGSADGGTYKLQANKEVIFAAMVSAVVFFASKET